ncbi:hypothetical protein [Megalodesulfovibrio gigas]|uniref:N-acetyltransferase domain-containing protein n=1 Tax=Megalodesulfovibrio gigas (strain ATCC 19364 / DSM 1382 / NCIMB 9332 / VKM B-1759) TaxID=1121448 RepID=T2GDL9_MEGG1|nr:hypothetical protein [Megalodesulfovibrio gigas]AGW14211.1 hypothetical protein DGI_2471 [Megalodesulfovibrio gigas DSM 1382 = ATCC 19364]
MECDIETLRAFLETVGCPSDVAAALDTAAPLAAQAIGPDVRAGLARLLPLALGLPAAPAALVDTGSLEQWRDFAARHLDDDTVRTAAVARIRATPTGEPPKDSSLVSTIALMRPEDAPGAARLLYLIYDTNYPVVDYYVPEKLIAMSRTKALLTLVARLEHGAIAGQIAMYRSSPPNPALYEQGQLLVDPAYRHTSIAYMLLKAQEELTQTMAWAEVFWGEPVCNHLVTQKGAKRQGYLPCGLELSLMPDEAYAKEGAPGRVSCLMAFRVVRDRPLPLYVPDCCRPVVEPILASLPLQREMCQAGPPAQAGNVASLGPVTVQTLRVFDQAQVARMQVFAVGQDIRAQVAALMDLAARQKLAVVQVYLNAADPGVVAAVAALRERGFLFGAFAPLWFVEGDALMLQWLAARPDFEAIRLLTDQAKTILAHIRREWDALAHDPAHDQD